MDCIYIVLFYNTRHSRPFTHTFIYRWQSPALLHVTLWRTSTFSQAAGTLFCSFSHHAGTHRRPLGCSDRAHRDHLRLSTSVLFFALRANLARKLTGSLFELSVTADYDCVFLFIYSINVSVVSE